MQKRKITATWMLVSDKGERYNVRHVDPKEVLTAGYLTLGVVLPEAYIGSYQILAPTPKPFSQW